MTRNEAATLALVARYARKPIALKVVAFNSRSLRNRGAVKPRLRLDRVAVGLVDRLRAALGDAVPDDRTIIVTITAPIRQASKTAAAIEDLIRLRLQRPSAARSAGRIHGNKIQVWILKGGTALTSKLVGFVHNPDRDPLILIELTRALLAASGPERRAGKAARARERWLVIENQAGLLPIESYRNVCGQLRLGILFEHIVVTLPGGGVEKLSCR